MDRRIFLFWGALVFLSGSFVWSETEARLLRFPTIHGDEIVFTCAGDLYCVSSSGGVARRLTGDIGYEMFARFSPDGKFIAFSGEYDGNTEVYLIEREGGIPRRLTFTATIGRDHVSDRMGPNNIVMGWKDTENIIYRSRGREWNAFKGQLYLVSKNGGPSEQLPFSRAGFCSYSPDKAKLAYNRVFREFRTWKRYRGGQADDIWIYDFASQTTTNITSDPGQDIIPMWHENKVYFLSDREKRMNLFSFDLTSRETKKLTNFADFDVKFPSLGDKAIVFENGGYIYCFDLATEEIKKISIYIKEDLSSTRPRLIQANEWIMDYEISPDGRRALFSARGDMFTVPVKNGPTRNLTSSSGVHERSPVWSPNGKWIAYISDIEGEDEIYIAAQDSKERPVALTSNANTYKYRLLWSPDSKKILYNDKLQRLQFVDIESREVTVIVQAKAWEIWDFNWSPDSRWVVYTYPEELEGEMNTLYLYSLEQKKSFPATDHWYTSYGATFSQDGKYLYFVSNRTFVPIYSWTEWNHLYFDMAKIYLLTLAKDTPSPFAPKSDEVEIKVCEHEEKVLEKKQDSVSVKVDVDGIVQRIAELPVSAASYWGLTSAGTRLYYLRKTNQEEEYSLGMYDFSKDEDDKEAILGKVDDFAVSTNRNKMLIKKGLSFFIVDLPGAKLELRSPLDMNGMTMNLNRHEEWKQIFNESWRQIRDFFFAPNMHGVDWKKVRENYAPLVSHVNHRADLTYIIGEMIGELNIGHTYVGGGDYPKARKISLGLLGAILQKDPETKYYRIQKILKGQNWNKLLRSPLTEIGVDVKEGHYIVAVNGTPTNEMADIYEALLNSAGKQVKLRINSVAKMEGSYDIVVIPTDNEQGLYYYNWVENNIAKVDKATNGRVGYIHVPDMSDHGLNEFVKHFYPQLKKEALIIDVRSNGGGNVSSMLVERLRRELVMISIARNTTISYDPPGMHYGPKVCLADEFSASDGDIFTYRFKYYKLGKVIGRRTWGGVVGIRNTLPIVDGGYLYKPEFSRYGFKDKGWIMEGYGVDPDIPVENDPSVEYRGIDQQLDKAIEVILEELKTWPKLPEIPPYPDKK